MNVPDRFPAPAVRACRRCGDTGEPHTEITEAHDDGPGQIHYLCWPCADQESSKPTPQELEGDACHRCGRPGEWFTGYCHGCTASGYGPGAAATAPEPDSGRRPVRMCARCCVITDTPVVVSEVHGASGAGFNVYACTECAPLFPKVPDALDLLETGWRRRMGDGTQ
jgi:hypothetical protein